jgi:hypothetical protein
VFQVAKVAAAAPLVVREGARGRDRESRGIDLGPLPRAPAAPAPSSSECHSPSL